MAWTLTSDVRGRTTGMVSGVGIGDDALGRATTYSYDTADRLTGVVDVIGDKCTTRAYGFDVRGNRTSQTTATFTDADCTAAGSPVTKSWSHDTADRVEDGATVAGVAGGGYVYDELGRQLTVPAVDTVTGAGSGDVEVGYFDSDAVHTLTRGDVQSVFALDAAGRRATETTTGTSGTETLVRHYGDGSDNPTWAEVVRDGETTTSWYGASLGGDLGLTLTAVAEGSPVVEVTLADPLGSIASTVTLTGDGPRFGTTGVYDEYGNTVTTASSTSVIDYGWLGAKERATNPATGLTLMGARLYNPVTGLFTSVDPVPGGNTTAYTYPQDPINKMDLDGKAWGWIKKKASQAWGWSKSASRWLTDSKWGKRIGNACSFAWGAIGAACGAVYSLAYARQERWAEAAVAVGGMVAGGLVTKGIGRIAASQRGRFSAAIRAHGGRYRAQMRRYDRTMRITANIYGLAASYGVDRRFNSRNERRA